MPVHQDLDRERSRVGIHVMRVPLMTLPGSRTSRQLLLATVLLCAFAGAAGAQGLTIERIASFPHVGGTPPSNLAWSPDGTRIAFLWNDKGMPFRDLWVIGADGADLKRLTDMAAAYPFEDIPDGDANEVLAQQVEARQREGLARTLPCCQAYPANRHTPAWTRDGRALVFAYRGVLFRVGADGTALTRLTRAEGDKYAVSFSPDGSVLSYLQDGDLWLWNEKAGPPVKATAWAAPPPGTLGDSDFTRPEAEFSTYAWSPDGRYIALHFDDRREVRTVLFPDFLGEETEAVPLRRDYTGDNRAKRSLVVYSVPDGRLHGAALPAPNERVFNVYAWSPDGTRLLADQSSMDARHRWISVITPGDMSVRERWHDQRERNSQLPASTWQSDGKGVLLVSDKDRRHHLYALSLEGGEPRQLTSGEWSVVGESGSAFIQVAAKTGNVFFVANKKNPYERHVYRMPQAGGEIVQITSLEGTHHPFLSPDASKVALLRSDDVTPRDLYVVDARGGVAERRLTHSPPADFARHRWVRPRYVTFKARDGVVLHGRLLEPPDLDRSKKYPIILGPVYPNSVRNRWGDREEWRGVFSSLQQFLVLERRYIVFQVDVRGSVGYGRDFRDQLTNYGTVEIEDLHSGVMFLSTLPYADASRVGIWGSSYGGLMTVTSLFKKPGVYKAGVASAPATNLWHALDGQERVVGRPHARPDLYREASAVSYGEALQDALLIIHGMRDDIVMFKDSVVLAEKLMMLGKKFDFAFAPSAVHAWSRQDYVAAYLLDKLVTHFDRHLGRGPVATPAKPTQP
jgi:dipeptidyl-peptidase-4